MQEPQQALREESPRQPRISRHVFQGRAITALPWRGLSDDKALCLPCALTRPSHTMDPSHSQSAYYPISQMRAGRRTCVMYLRSKGAPQHLPTQDPSPRAHHPHCLVA